MNHLLQSVAHGLLVGLIFVVVRWIAPSTAHLEYPASVLEKAYVRYRPLEVIATILYVAVFLPTALGGWAAILIATGRLRDYEMPAHLLLIRLQPEWVSWGLPILFLGLLSGYWLFLIVFRPFFSTESWQLMTAAMDYNRRFDGRKVNRWITHGIILMATAWIVVNLDWYTRFEAERMAINPLFAFQEKVYTYDRITKLVESTHLVAPSGKLVERTRQFVVFDDGEKWCHDDLLRDPKPLIELLKWKTGRSFERVRFIEDALK
jgi:hypothetical protein